jgi:hypothetical protein
MIRVFNILVFYRRSGGGGRAFEPHEKFDDDTHNKKYGNVQDRWEITQYYDRHDIAAEIIGYENTVAICSVNITADRENR